ncbi:MAG: chorismate--pyruvate lyase family protein [Thermodesulfobacteriota bacterium]
MTTRFAYTLVRDWVGAQGNGEMAELAGLKPHQKLLLLSDGSMTLDLELLFGSMVEVELRFTGTTPLSPDDAGYLKEAPGSPAMEREVWLTVEGRRLVYAHSLIPLGRVEAGLKGALDEHSGEPLGRVLNSRKVFFAKDKLDVGVVTCAGASEDLGAAPDTPLLARRYILFNRDESGNWIIKAAVTEIFSPEIVSARLLNRG